MFFDLLSTCLSTPVAQKRPEGTDGQTYGQDKIPLILQNIAPFGAAAQKRVILAIHHYRVIFLIS